MDGGAIKSVPDPGPPTLREAVEGLLDNVFESARAEQFALVDLRALPLQDPQENAHKNRVRRHRSDQVHWREMLAAYRATLETHPELADKPIGTKCAHGCKIGHPLPSLVRAPAPDRETGADDDEIQHDRRLPPERELSLPF